MITTSPAPLSVAFLGTRHPHVFHRLALLQRTPDVSLLGYYDEDADVAHQFGARTGLQRWTSQEELLRAKPDLVILEGLDPQIPEQAVAAAPYVRALLLEKPAAPNRAAMEWMVEQLARFPVHVAVGYELHYSEALQWCQEVLASGSLGDLTLARIHGGCPIGTGAEPWQSIESDRGGFLFTEGCHMLELALSCLGAPDQVLGAVRTLPSGQPFVSDLVIADLFTGRLPQTEVAVGTLRYEDVAAGVLFYPSMLTTFDLTAWEATDWVEDWKIEFYGTNGTLTMWPHPPAIEVFLRHDRGDFPAGRTRRVGRVVPGSATSSTLEVTYRRELDQLLDHLRAGDPPSMSILETARDVVRVLDAFYQSAEDGRLVSVAREP